MYGGPVASALKPVTPSCERNHKEYAICKREEHTGEAVNGLCDLSEKKKRYSNDICMEQYELQIDK